MINTTRKLIKNSKRSVRQGIRKYNLHQHAWTDESFSLIKFVGKVDKNNQKDRNALHAGLVKIIGESSVSNYPYGSRTWHIERIFTFENSGVVVISTQYSIGD